MKRSVVRTDKAPAAIGPYSQAVGAGQFLFCAGQIPIDPSTGRLVEGEIETQAQRVLDNLQGVLGAAGCVPGDVVRLDVYLVDLSLFTRVNAVLAKVFPESPPSRVTVGVSALPMGAAIEMAAIAVRK